MHKVYGDSFLQHASPSILKSSWPAYFKIKTKANPKKKEVNVVSSGSGQLMT